MAERNEQAVAEIDAVMGRFGVRLTGAETTQDILNSPQWPQIAQNRAQAMSAWRACIERNLPDPSYRVEMQRAEASSPDAKALLGMLGVLLSVRSDLEAGYTTTLAERVRDEVFGDLLDIAESIVKLHAAPAIVLAVSVLEEHVRKMCEARDLSTLKDSGRGFVSFEDMTADLLEANAITSTEKRQMTNQWYAQRTEAAHGRFENVIAEEAPRTIGGVRDFIVRHPG